MTTLLFLFLIALGLALVLTPLVKWLGVRLEAMDFPADQKVHTMPLPRIGGLFKEYVEVRQAGVTLAGIQ